MSSYLKNNSEMVSRIPNTEEEIDLKEVISSLMKYKKSMIIVTVVITMLSVLIALSTDNTYQATMTLQVQTQSAGQGTSTQGDMMAVALGMPNTNMANEITILKSRSIAQKVLEKIHIGNRYYVDYGIRKHELYTQSPFTVHAQAISEKLIGYEFQLKEVDANHYRLVLEPTFWKKIGALFGSDNAIKSSTYIDKVYAYGELVSTPDYRLSVFKKAPLGSYQYYFTITPNNYMVGMIQSSLGVAVGEDKGSILTLSYQDNVQQRAQDILNIIAQSYTDQSVTTKSASAEQTLGFIDEQLNAVKKALHESSINLKDYKSSHVVINIESKAGVAVQNLNTYENQLYQLQVQENMLRGLLAYMKHNKEMTGIDLTGASPSIMSLIQKIQEVSTLHSSLLVDFTDKHPSVIKANEQMAALRSNLQGTIESSLRSIDEQKRTLNTIVDKHTGSIESLPGEEQQLNNLNRNFMFNEKIYEYLLQKRAETAIAKSSTVSGIRIIDSALASPKAVQPNRPMIVVFGIVIGLMIGLLQAFIRYFIANTIQSIGDIQRSTFLPLYGFLPEFKEKKSLYEDAMRVLLTRLEFDENKPKVITITSSVHGEGRTTTALELSSIIAQSGKKVIVLDLDMRASRLNQKLAINNGSGMSSYLSGEKEFSEVVKSLDTNRDVVVAGPIPNNPYQLVISKHLPTLLEELRGQYDYILLESPPVGLVADALVLMRLSDLNFVVFKAGYSKKDFVKNTNRFVQEHQLENVGIIINGLDLKRIRPWLRK